MRREGESRRMNALESETNPYASPVAADTADESLAAPVEFRSMSAFAALAVGCLLVESLLGGVYGFAIASWMEKLSLLQSLGGATKPEDIAPYLLWQRQSYLLFASAHIAAWLLFFCWVYGSYRNLRALGNTELDSSPVWAVAWYFVPLFALVRPFQAVREIRIGSDPKTMDLAHEDWRYEPVTLLRWWWGFHLAAYFIQYLVNYIAREAKTWEALHLSAVVSLLAIVCLYLPHVFLKASVIRQITALQSARHEKILAEEGAAI